MTRYKLEVLFIALYTISTIAIPLWRAEFFPYSSFELFTDAPNIYATYKLNDKEGNEIDLGEAKLHRNYNGIVPRAPYARTKPFSFDRFGEVLTKEEITDVLNRKLDRKYFPVTVKVITTGVRNGKVQDIDQKEFIVEL